MKLRETILYFFKKNEKINFLKVIEKFIKVNNFNLT
jgi:hypothetical protein